MKPDDILSTSLGTAQELTFKPCAHDELPWDLSDILPERMNYLVARAEADVDHVALLFAPGAAVQIHEELYRAGLVHRSKDGTGVAFFPRELLLHSLMHLSGAGSFLQRLCAPTPGVLYILAFSVDEVFPVNVTSITLPPSPVSS